MFEMFFFSRTKDQDVVKIYQQKKEQLVLEYLVHESLEDDKSIDKTKYQDQKFVESKENHEYSLEDIFQLNSDLMIF